MGSGNEGKCADMIERFTQFLIHRPVAVSTVYAALVASGLFALERLPVDLTPAVDFPALSIQTAWPGVPAETVEMILTSPIEETAHTIPGIRRVSSVSSEGHSRVHAEFEPKTKMDFARLELYEKLAALVRTLPPGIGSPALDPYVPEDLRDLHGFMSYSLVGTQSASVLRNLGQGEIAPRLRSIRGVADVVVLGGEEEEVHIELDAQKILSLGLRVEELTAGLNTLEYNAPVGVLSRSSTREIVSVRTADLTLDRLKRVPITHTSSGSPVRLGDIATVSLTTGEKTGLFRINGKASVTIRIDKDPSVNTLRLADGVSARIQELRSLLPEGVELILESDTSRDMRAELAALYRDSVLSILCILIVLFLFLGHWNAPLVVFSSILFSLAGTFLLFWLLGIGLHLFSLAGLILGSGRLVDDSIVVLDNIQRRGALDTSRTAIPSAMAEIALPVIASTGTTIGALLPTGFLPADLKPYFFQFALAVGVSLVMSLVVSCTLIPVIAHRVRLSPLLPDVYAGAGEWGMRTYAWLLRKVLTHRLVVMFVVLWLFGIPIWLLPENSNVPGFPGHVYNTVFGSGWYRAARPYLNQILGGSCFLFFTKVRMGEVWEYQRETYLIVRVTFPQGMDLHRCDDIAKAVESEALSFGAHIEKVTCLVEQDYAFIRITIPDARASTEIPFIVKNRLTKLASQTGGASIGIWGFGPGFTSGGETPPTFAVRVLGYNYERVKVIAERIRTRLEANPRIADVDINRSWTGQRGKAAEVVAYVDRLEAARHDIPVAELVNAIRTHTPGAVHRNRLTIDGIRVPYTVKFAGYQECSAEELQNVMITGRERQTVRLLGLLSLRKHPTPGEILRENRSYVRWISFEYRGPLRHAISFVDASIRATVLPHGYRVDRSASGFTFSENDRDWLLLTAGIALALVYMITASLYESFKNPLLIILAVPFSLIGLFQAYYLTDTPFGRGGYAAVFLLIGIVVTNSIMLVDCLSRQCGRHGCTVETLVAAAGQRLRPVLMTTLTTTGGLLPMALFGERSGISSSLALGTIGGLLSSMCLTLLLIPLAYRMIHRREYRA